MKKPNAALSARRLRIVEGEPFPTPFYDRATELVSRELLGAVLECRTSDGISSGRIVEVEAYLGPQDPACHAVAGLTSRTEHLHGPPGRAYVYRIYGMHWCLNAVTREAGHGSAVLIRALEPLDGLALMRRRRLAARHDRDLANGPGKLCQALGIDRSLDGATLDGTRIDGASLSIIAAAPVADREVRVSPRIGITKAADWPLRWFLVESPAVTRTPSSFPVFSVREAAAAIARLPKR
ncbi:MAG: DNA-3-methyladenine glycosylase [Gemmatimonadaceae bacterium]